MNLHAVSIVYRKELTEWLRDRRTLISTVLVPLFIFPILMGGFGATASRMVGEIRNEIPTVMILGGDDSPQVLQSLHKIPTISIVPSVANWKDQIINKQIRAAVEIPGDFQDSLTQGGGETVKIYYYEGDLKSSAGADRLEKFFTNYRDRVVKTRLAANDLPVSILTPFSVRQENVAPPEKVGGAMFGSFIGYFAILLCMTGAMYPAIDLTAGEKERGTMETILSSPVARMDLVLGKFALVLSASLATLICSAISMGASLLIFGHFQLAGSKDVPVFQLDLGLSTITSIFVMTLPLAVLFSALLMTIALFAKSYKEAQSYLMPLTFLIVIPAVASVLPGVELTPKLALIPVLNTSLVCKEIISGTYHWHSIILIFLSTCVYASAALLLAIKTFQRESVLFRS